jgi:putative FmdB family regulatory protein
VPVYEYRCPNGHTFDVFHKMDDPAPEVCEVCGKGPLVKVLHPVPVFFKGSGFYSTDYGSKRRSKDGGDDSSSSSSDSSKSDDSSTTKPEKTEKKKETKEKAAES